MTIARSDIVTGPGTVQLGAAGPVFYDKDGIDAAWEITRGEVLTSVFGKVDEFMDDRLCRIAFTPAGEIASADITALYPHQNPSIGDDIFGASDTACIVHSKAGQKVTFHAAAITAMPDLILSPGKTAFGQAQITAILKNEGDPANDDSFYTVAAEAWSDTSFASANVKRLIYSAAWSTIFTSIITEDGWTLSFDMGVTYRKVDDYGTVKASLESVDVMAKCRPVNLSESDVLDALRLQDTGGARGTSHRQNKDLVITGTGSALVATIKDAALVEGPLRWGSTDLRIGEIGFIGQRAESAGSFGNLFTITVS